MLIVILACIAGLAASIPLPNTEIAQPRADDSAFQLPTDITPSNYDVTLKILDFEQSTFTGTVEITIKVTKATKQIVLHKRDITIENDKVTVKEKGVSTLLPRTTEATYNETLEFYTIELDDLLAIDKEYVVKIQDFVAKFGSNKRGLYIAKYGKADEDAEDLPHKLAVTQFEPTSAREAFPCFDEPGLKATFKIHIEIPKAWSAVSNTLTENEPAAGAVTKEVHFLETQPMSTYLVALIVYDPTTFKLSGKEADFTRVLAETVDIEKKYHEYAATTGATILRSIETFLDVPYTLPKMVHAAIPDDHFSAGAMENWGLITYKKSALLKTERTTTAMHQGIDTIIAHELGHQWFGNLATEESWEYLWLSEGFATYLQYIGADLANPDLKLKDQFVLLVTQNTFPADSLSTTRLMNQAAWSPNAISRLFDKIAYGKSGAVIRMMESFLTTEVFTAGLKLYLADRKYKTATPEHLYDNLQKALENQIPVKLPTGLTVKKIMQTWDSQKGFPVVTATRTYGEKPMEVTLDQKHFVLDITPSKDLWSIPINYATASSSEATLASTSANDWLTTASQKVDVAGLKDEDWMILNKHEAYYYRVNYDENNWDLLTYALQDDPSKIPTLNRAQLLDDSFNLARGDLVEYSVPLNISLYLEKEEDYIPLQSFLTAISFLDTMTGATEVLPLLQKHVLEVLEKPYEHFTFTERKNDTHTDKLARVSLISWMCKYEHSDCLENSNSNFAAWKKNAKLPLDLEGAILCGAMRSADEENWEYLHNFVTKEDELYKSDVVSALGCSTNKTILENFLERSLPENSPVSFQSAVSSVLKGGPLGVEVVLEYVINYFQFLDLIVNGNIMNSIIYDIGSRITTQEEIDELEALSQKYTSKPEAFKRALKKAEENVEWNKNHLEDLEKWFKGNGALMLQIPLVLSVLLISLLQLLK